MICIPRARGEYTYNYSSYLFRLSSGSDVLRTAIGLFHRHLRTVIVEGTAHKFYLTLILSALIDLNPFQVTGNQELGFLWIADILNSGYEEDWRCWMVCRVLRALEKRFPPDFSAPHTAVHPTLVPSVLGSLLLC